MTDLRAILETCKAEMIANGKIPQVIVLHGEKVRIRRESCVVKDAEAGVDRILSIQFLESPACPMDTAFACSDMASAEELVHLLEVGDIEAIKDFLAGVKAAQRRL